MTGNISIEHMLLRLGVALAIGLLIGLERGWKGRDEPEGSRVAGIRTFGLLGFLGGTLDLISQNYGVVFVVSGFVVVGALLITAHYQQYQTERDAGITTVIAALVTYSLGVLAMEGLLVISSAGAVVTVALLSVKKTLHEWLRRMEQFELYSLIKLLLISVVILPILPDKGYGPWQALNPYEIWWLVVLIAGISFSGYVAIRIVGVHRGILLTSLLGGLVSSTATTINLSKIGRHDVMSRTAATGIIVTSSTMFLRMLLVIMIINPALISTTLLPLLFMGLSGMAIGGWRFVRDKQRINIQDLPLRNPLELLQALGFGALLAAIMLLVEAFKEYWGNTGILVLAGLSGVLDVDAITISLARLEWSASDSTVIAFAIFIAAGVNTVVKAGIASFISGGRVAAGVWPAFLVMLLVGGLALFGL